MTIQLLNKVNEVALAEVKKEMKELGAPEIRAFWSNNLDCWVAIEGSHRLTAALQLGLTPNIIAIDPETPINQIGDLDLDWDEDGIPVVETDLPINLIELPQNTWVGRYLYFDLGVAAQRHNWMLCQLNCVEDRDADTLVVCEPNISVMHDAIFLQAYNAAELTDFNKVSKQIV